MSLFSSCQNMVQYVSPSPLNSNAHICHSCISKSIPADTMASLQNIECLIQRIRDNDPSLTEIDFRNVDGSRSYNFQNNSTEFRDFLAALRVNHTVTSVNMILRFLKDLTKEEKFELFEAVGSLPNLQQFRLGSSGLAGLHMDLVNAALQKTRGTLKSLTLQSIHFKDNVLCKSGNPRNTKDSEYIEFLKILRHALKDSLESFAIQDVEDSFDLDPLVSVLTTLPNLKELTIQSHSPINQRLTQQSVIKLFASKSIQSLSLRRLRLGPILPELLVSLEDNTTLRSLALEQNGLNFECGMALAYLLTSNSTLQELYLGYNMIPDDCGSAMAAALANNQTLHTLDLAANGLELYASRRFAHLIASSESAMQNLTLNQNALRDEGVAMIAAGLGRNETLKSLSLAETLITEASCNVIAASLQTNATLERLNLADNKVKDEGCKALAFALKRNSTLTSINLHGNQLRDKSVVEFAEMLKSNTTLKRVKLSKNLHLTHAAYQALEDMLVQDNYTLQHLWLPSTVDIVMPHSDINTFIRLNRLGRRQLLDELDNAPLWLQTLKAAASEDLRCLYFLVRTNPTVVSWLPSR